jgi:hypothetical protein
MERKPALVLLARPGHDAKAQLVHAASFGLGHAVLGPVATTPPGPGKAWVVSLRLDRLILTSTWTRHIAGV